MGIRPDKDPNAPENQPELCPKLGHKWDWVERGQGWWYLQCDRCAKYSNGTHTLPSSPDHKGMFCPGPERIPEHLRRRAA